MYYSPEKLSEPELKELIDQTLGQLTDGLGEDGVSVFIGDHLVHVEYADIYRENPFVSAEQLPITRKTAGKKRRSPIFSALLKGDLETAKKYVTPTDLASTEKWGQTALMVAIREGYTEFAADMIESGADINHEAHATGSTPLFMTAMAGDIRILEVLIKRGVDINKQEEDPEGISTGMTALMWACNRKHPKCVKMLLENGADPFLKNVYGYDAHHYAKLKNIRKILDEYTEN